MQHNNGEAEMRRFENLMFLVVPILLILAAVSASMGPTQAGPSAPSTTHSGARMVAAAVNGR